MHVVIIGAGFGGLTAAQTLGSRRDVRVTIIDRHNYHLFVPLLYQVATAALSPADIAEPVRRIVSRHRNITVALAEVIGIDAAAKQVLIEGAPPIAYDRLIVATGSTHNYFGHDDWARFAPSLKTIEDARAVRTRVLLGFERAELSGDPAEQRRLMTTVIVGGGPTGVEVAGSVAELAKHALARDFRRINPRDARIILLEAGPRILAGFPQSLGDYSMRALAKLGVTVMTQQKVEKIDDQGVVINGVPLPAGTVVWGAGVAASPAARWLGVEPDRSGRIKVATDLSVPGFEGVYAIGDTALCLDERGAALPGLAQVATQQGKHLGRALARQIERGEPLPAFEFHDRGNTAIIGRHSAVFDFGFARLRGWSAWSLWAIVHVVLLINFEQRFRVSLQWFWRYLTYRRSARLISEG